MWLLPAAGRTPPPEPTCVWVPDSLSHSAIAGRALVIQSISLAHSWTVVSPLHLTVCAQLQYAGLGPHPCGAMTALMLFA